jgi:hypothetical protein
MPSLLIIPNQPFVIEMGVGCPPGDTRFSAGVWLLFLVFRRVSSSKCDWSIGELLGFDAAVLQLIFRDFRLKKFFDKVGETSVFCLASARSLAFKARSIFSEIVGSFIP